ncbi:MAG: metallophosphoesterase family protein, partial [Actinomycetota bacterium]|nr:metallophosphoesterase family protein [Actinomycetota bacterium]
MLVGVISDTHGTLPASVAQAFRGVEQIVHAGDVGSQQVLDELEAIAPVVAVRG